MAKRLTTSEARAQFSEIVSKAEFGGERTILHRRKKPVAAVVPIEDLALIERYEDELDLRAAKKALKDPRRIPWEKIKEELGL